jgi:HAD superfamily hydrolase (TIGR01509 family)
MPIRGVIFDLGGTLLHYKEAGTTWEDMEKRGAQAAYRLLREAGYMLPPEQDALATAWDHLLSIWNNLDACDVNDLTLAHQLRLVLARWGVDGVAPDLFERLPVVYMQAIQSIVGPLDGAADTLRSLRGQGMKIGLISNTTWPGEFHRQDMDRYGLTSFFDHLIFSADEKAWKPHQEVFRRSLAALGLSPDEAVFVGDSLYFDVWGAQQAGLRGVWIEQDQRSQPAGMEDIQPDATIRRLPELLDIVRSR